MTDEELVAAWRAAVDAVPDPPEVINDWTMVPYVLEFVEKCEAALEIADLMAARLAEQLT